MQLILGSHIRCKMGWLARAVTNRNGHFSSPDLGMCGQLCHNWHKLPLLQRRDIWDVPRPDLMLSGLCVGFVSPGPWCTMLLSQSCANGAAQLPHSCRALNRGGRGVRVPLAEDARTSWFTTNALSTGPSTPHLCCSQPATLWWTSGISETAIPLPCTVGSIPCNRKKKKNLFILQILVFSSRWKQKPKIINCNLVRVMYEVGGLANENCLYSQV